MDGKNGNIEQVIIALDMLKVMREEASRWKTKGMLVGTPVLSSNSAEEIPEYREILHTSCVRQHPEFTLSKPIRFGPERAGELFVFLGRNEAILCEISKRDAEANKIMMFLKRNKYSIREIFKSKLFHMVKSPDQHKKILTKSGFF